MKSCDTCKYSGLSMEPGGALTKNLVCRYDQPKCQLLVMQTAQGPQQQVVSYWPPVQPIDWCRLFEPQSH